MAIINSKPGGHFRNHPHDRRDVVFFRPVDKAYIITIRIINGRRCVMPLSAKIKIRSFIIFNLTFNLTCSVNLGQWLERQSAKNRRKNHSRVNEKVLDEVNAPFAQAKKIFHAEKRGG